MGVMIESNLVAGKQSIPDAGPVGLTYGQSVTDACIDWKTTVETLDELRRGVQKRREVLGGRSAGRVLMNGVRESEEMRNGRGDFNDVGVFPTA